MKELVKKNIISAVKKTGYQVPQNFNIEVPPKSELGDYSTNIAMVIGAKSKQSPVAVAEKIIKVLLSSKDIEKADIAGPGFINIFINETLYYQELGKILSEKYSYGKENPKRKKVQVEYVSANPTGPLHIGNARGGPIGESLANLFAFLGYDVEREFYINDVGGQIDRFAESLYYWYAKKNDPKLEFPEKGYPGEYIKEISNLIQEEKKTEIESLDGDKDEILKIFKHQGLYYTIRNIREDCALIGITFDRWINQSDFAFSEKTDKVIEELEKKGATVKKEGALWFKNPDDPDLKDKESVLKKSDEMSSLTYFADDIAYHLNKFERGNQKVIDVWGSNHHGHIARLKGALKVLGIDPEKIQIILYQYVRLKNAGGAVKMGKRFGNFVTLRQVIESGVAPDAFKYFILAQNPNTPFDFDLKLASDASEKNPVFYIKYAHARICSILSKWDSKTKQKGRGEVDPTKADFNLLKNPKEVALYKELVKFPELIFEASENFQVQSLPHFAYKIATLFHDFYTECKVISDDKKLSTSRLSLILATKYVLANVLSLCGIEAPEKM